MYGFNYLLPALVFKLQIFVSHEVGLLDVGYTVYNGQSMGTVESAAGYNTTVNATIVHMDDFFTLYGDKSYYGITPRGLMVTDDGEYVKIEASGLFAATDKVKALLAKEPNVNATEWGEMYSASVWSFETGSTKYKDLQDSMFVGNFRLSPGNADNSSIFNVEYTLSKILSGPP